MLNKGQQLAAYLAEQGEMLCIIGAGGTGKSYLIDYLSNQEDWGTVITATTGTAAVNIAGTTFHSSFSVPIGYYTPNDLKTLFKRTTAIFRGDNVDRIIIDEGSMLTPSAWKVFHERLIKWNKRRARKQRKPIQVILVMDILQLGEIIRGRELDLTMDEFRTTKFYKTEEFKSMGFKVVELTQSMRQADAHFKKMLDNIRYGVDLEETVKWFNDTCYGQTLPKDCTILTTTNKMVDEYNRRVFSANPNPAAMYTAKVDGNFKVKDAPVPEKLILKEGLRVMLVKNCPEGNYVNGSTGVVTMFTNDGPWVKLDGSGEELVIPPATWEAYAYGTDSTTGELYKYAEGSFEQVPIKQCASISVHKAQGATLAKYILDPSYGMGWAKALAYVALSRATSPESIYLKRKLRVEDISVDQEAVAWLNENKVVG